MDTLYEDIAHSILQECSSPTVSSFHALYEKDFNELVQKGAKGVVFICKKFCEPYDYLFAYYQERLRSVGIPIIRVYTDDMEYETNTVWETFYEMI
jgi:benzoyl-CoA reductase/2-hydroxyglutaryl-CoA dehydratase subunit BcrC/BadD/HgdB